MTTTTPIKTLIAVDPGVSTGVVVFDRGELIASMTDRAPYDALVSVLRDFHNATVVCEAAPQLTRHNREAHEAVLSVLNDVSSDITFIRPNQWKGHPQSSLDGVDRVFVNTVHEHDAARLGRWFLRRHGDPNFTNTHSRTS